MYIVIIKVKTNNCFNFLTLVISYNFNFSSLTFSYPNGCSIIS